MAKNATPVAMDMQKLWQCQQFFIKHLLPARQATFNVLEYQTSLKKFAQYYDLVRDQRAVQGPFGEVEVLWVCDWGGTGEGSRHPVDLPDVSHSEIGRDGHLQKREKSVRKCSNVRSILHRRERVVNPCNRKDAMC